MQRHQPSLAEFGAADGQHRGLEIDIVKLEVAGFAEAQTRNTEEPEQTVVEPRTQPTAFIAVWHGERGAQQVANLGVRVEVGSRPLRLKGQQALRRNLRAGIGRAAILRKSSDEAQAPSPMRRLSVRWLLRPGERQRLGDVGRAVLLHEPDEIE
jgi:hypothetical protein